MGLFSFGNKDDAPRRRGANAKPARGEGVERRSRRAEQAGGAPPKGTSFGADAMLLDPTLPEKQRARRRLVGAIALVIAAVVLLPMVLDSHPKPVTDDIAIDIPARPATVPQSTGGDDAAADAQAGVAPDNPEASAATSAAASGVAPLVSSQGADQPAKQAKAPQRTQQAQSGSQVRPQAAAKPQQPAAAATQAAKPAAMPAPSTADADSGTPAAPPGARFAVQLGVFADDASARGWETKLKAAGVPAYIEHRKQADGTTRTLLRAGPFADRGAASAAIAKVRDAGLTANAAQ